MVDVIQAVGRVMRKAEGKDIGYIILPVGIPADETPEQALNNNKRFKAYGRSSTLSDRMMNA